MDLILAVIGIWALFKGEINIGGGKRTTKKQGRLLGGLLLFPVVVFALLPSFDFDGVIVYLAVIIGAILISRNVPISMEETEVKSDGQTIQTPMANEDISNG